ncbi:MAG TPA: hypothetical protein VER37_01430 [Thermomicrobiales bacterium]|jgi:hypothetical protein|nr:hypothetical protein [Thermomicrobiales bacterium]
MRTINSTEARRLLAGLAVAGLLSVSVASGASAQETAAAGNGGGSNASADGGGVGMTDVDSGGNSGTTTSVGDIVAGAVAVGGDDIAANIIAQILGS